VLKNAQAGLIKQAGELLDSKEAAEERGYLSDVALAHQLWRANDLGEMKAALARCPAGRRRWEWHHLDGLSRPERARYLLDSPPLALAYSPDGKTLAFLTLAGTLSAVDTATGRDRVGPPPRGGLTPGAQLDARGGRNRALAFRPDGKEVAVACGDRLYLVDTTAPTWKAAEFTPPKAKGGAADRHSYVALGYAKDGRLLGATVRDDGKTRETKITIRDVRGGAVVSTLGAWGTPEGVVAELAGAAFSPDGARFAASAVDSGIRVSSGKGAPVKFEPFQPKLLVWNVASGGVLFATESGSSLFGSVAFAPDGEIVGFGRRGLAKEASSNRGGPKVGKDEIVFDRPPQTYAGHVGEVLAVAFGGNGLLWSGGEGKLVVAHDRRTGDERFALRGCPAGVLRLAVSPDGKEVAAAAGEITGSGSVLRFDVGGLARDLWRSPAARDRISFVAALAPDGSRFAAADFSPAEGPEAGRLLLRETAGGFERVMKSPGMLLVAAMRPGGGLVLHDRGKQLRLTDAAGEPVRDFPLPAGLDRQWPPALACAPDGKIVAAVGPAEVVRPPRPGAPATVRWAAFGHSMPVPVPGVPARPQVRVRLTTWDADTGKPGVPAEADLSQAVPQGIVSANVMPTAAATDREGKRLAATFLIGCQDERRNRFELRGALVVWDLGTGKEVFRRFLGDDRFHAVAFDTRGRVVVGGGRPAGGAVYGWDLATGKQELLMFGHTRPILSLAFSPDGRLATGGADRVVKVWDLASGREVLTLDGFAREVTHVAFTKDGKDLVAATGLDLVSTMLAGGLPTDWPPAEVRVFRGPK
jgi:WD40 repeat protein